MSTCTPTSRTTFVGFDKAGPPADAPGGVEAAALSTCNHCDFPNTMCNGAKTSVVRDSTWIDSTNRVRWGLPFKGIILDVDGTLAGDAAHKGHTLVPSWAHLESSCGAPPATLAGAMPGGSLSCAPAARAFRFAVHSQTPYTVFVESALHVTNLADGKMSKVPYKNNKWHEPKDGWALALASGGSYDLSTKHEADFTVGRSVQA